MDLAWTALNRLNGFLFFIFLKTINIFFYYPAVLLVLSFLYVLISLLFVIFAWLYLFFPILFSFVLVFIGFGTLLVCFIHFLQFIIERFGIFTKTSLVPFFIFLVGLLHIFNLLYSRYLFLLLLVWFLGTFRYHWSIFLWILFFRWGKSFWGLFFVCILRLKTLFILFSF